MTESAKETLQRVRARRAAFAKKKAEASAAKKKAETPVWRPEAMEAMRELVKSEPDNSKALSLIKKRSIADDSYWDLLTTIKTSRGISWLEAMRCLERETDPARHRQIKQQYLDDVNAEREAARGGPQPIEKAEGRTWPEMVSYLKLNHGMSTLQAQRHIDKHYPGLRQGFIDKCNE